MKLNTTILDGVDLELAPVTYTKEPINTTSIGSGHQGRVHFRWLLPDTHYRLVLEYEDLDMEETRRLVSVFGPSQQHSRILSFDNEGSLHHVIPGRVALRARIKRGKANLTIETIGSPIDLPGASAISGYSDGVLDGDSFVWP